MEPIHLGELLRYSAARTPHKPAVICGEQVVSYQALNQSTEALAHTLLSKGLERGDRVALHWCNSIDLVKLYFACFKAGLIAVPVNNRMKAPEIAHVLRHSKAKLCFSQPELATLSEGVRSECPDLDTIYTALPSLGSTEHGNVQLPKISPE